jgi:hypothetical protein
MERGRRGKKERCALSAEFEIVFGAALELSDCGQRATNLSRWQRNLDEKSLRKPKTHSEMVERGHAF